MDTTVTTKNENFPVDAKPTRKYEIPTGGRAGGAAAWGRAITGRRERWVPRRPLGPRRSGGGGGRVAVLRGGQERCRLIRATVAARKRWEGLGLAGWGALHKMGKTNRNI